MVVTDEQSQIWYEDEDNGKKSQKLQEHEDGQDVNNPVIGNEELDGDQQQSEGQTDQEMDETLKTAAIPKETKSVLHKAVTEWDSRFDDMLSQPEVRK